MALAESQSTVELVRRTPIELAAVATAAVPGLTPTAVASAPDDAADFDSALLLDSDGKRWRVRSPRHPEASTRLETESMVLRAFAPGIRAELPFLVPNVAGKVRQGGLSTFVYSHLAGTTRSIEDLSGAGGTLPRDIGAAMAAIHDLPQSLVNNADLPSYTPNEFRQRKLNELDQAATTGKIPPLLLRRWEHALEDVSLWRFNPCVVHGDLHEDNLLVEDGTITAVTGWTDLRIGDPADDVAWLVASNEQGFVDTVLHHYAAARRDTPDSHILRRAALLAEFALAQYLVKALAAGQDDMIAEAEGMLVALSEDIIQDGAQPIGHDDAQGIAATASGDSPASATKPVQSANPAPPTDAIPVVQAPAVHVGPIPEATIGDGGTDNVGSSIENGSGIENGAGDHFAVTVQPLSEADRSSGDASSPGDAAGSAAAGSVANAAPATEPVTLVKPEPPVKPGPPVMPGTGVEPGRAAAT
jgi:aminoglycoside phosphotransferase (APT) family kinase protein